MQIALLGHTEEREGVNVRNMYKLELQLVKEFQSNLANAHNPFAVSDVAIEFNYNNGKVDIIGKTRDGNLVAFEAKLSRWRVALNQAYRNTSFAHYSYVVLPELSAKKALNELHEFERRGVGLCSVGSHGTKVEIPASRKDPLQPWLTNIALNYISKD